MKMATAQTDRDVILGLVRERIVSYAASRIGRDAAEDLAQETLMLLNEKYAHLDSRDDLVPVAVRIMQFKMRTERRSRRTDHVEAETAVIADGAPDPESKARYEELRARIMVAVEKLGDRCRRLFLLKLDGYNFIEIREQMGADSINTIYTWDFRCRQELRKLTAKESGA